jgi:hypothetical protein
MPAFTTFTGRMAQRGRPPHHGPLTSAEVCVLEHVRPAGGEGEHGAISREQRS